MDDMGASFGAADSACASHSRQRPWLRELAELIAGAELVLHVNGTCMSPHVEPGGRIRVRRARAYWPGDVLAVIDPAAGDIKLHRCIGYTLRAGEFCVVTRPDAESSLDRPTPYHLVIGRLSGGDCTPDAVAVPWSTRLAALRVLLTRAADRLNPYLGDPARFVPGRGRGGS
jgi:hypothetical protein